MTDSWMPPLFAAGCRRSGSDAHRPSERDDTGAIRDAVHGTPHDTAAPDH
ncbi:hypothetical protein ACFWFF_06615 [Streptomyces sp. NPDC060223]